MQGYQAEKQADNRSGFHWSFASKTRACELQHHGHPYEAGSMIVQHFGSVLLACWQEAYFYSDAQRQVSLGSLMVAGLTQHDSGSDQFMLLQQSGCHVAFDQVDNACNWIANHQQDQRCQKLAKLSQGTSNS